ncbi:MAG: hypothetical protein KAU20_00920 [Nanoarchaeota archaeon]|nr:hypothetical protein [Nanoarchaeota archaeon]
MDKTEKILLDNIEEYYTNAIEAEIKLNYNTSVTLFFKVLSALCDLYIFRKEGHIPTSHTNRFRILETKYRDIYNIMDKDFPFYQDSYRAKLSKETSDMLKQDVKKLSKLLGIEL